ncbi:hypothetical protein K7X08_023778 [Anisodus acutangulus]|uniref:Uncharacterized protein n=1 Tax=Anisodus acutangulus TaxID=402998 RepID=A0A9Q1L7U9_9SOLA|nr:hypothetical protein K7X08_023778 [Anisodus acutangulus]
MAHDRKEAIVPEKWPDGERSSQSHQVVHRFGDDEFKCWNYREYSEEGEVFDDGQGPRKKRRSPRKKKTYRQEWHSKNEVPPLGIPDVAQTGKSSQNADMAGQSSQNNAQLVNSLAKRKDETSADMQNADHVKAHIEEHPAQRNGKQVQNGSPSVHGENRNIISGQ